MTHRILIVGCGNIGYRHLEATIHAGVTEIWIVEKDIPRLARRIAESKLDERADLRLYPSLDQVRELNLEFCCVISGLTTNAQVELFPSLTALNSKCYLLEKPIAQARDSLADLWEQVQRGPGCEAVFVNCSRDTWSGYVKVRDKLTALRSRGQCTFHVEVFGNLWGLGCNGVHYLELCRMFTGSTKIEPVWQQLSSSPLGNKRGPEFEEFVGTVAFKNEHGDTFELNSAFNNSKPQGPSILVKQLHRADLFLVDEEQDLLIDLQESQRAGLGTVYVSRSTQAFLARLFAGASNLGLPRFQDVMVGQAALLGALTMATGRERAAIT